MRSGTTLIEVLIAMVILEFWMLAIVATSAVAARDLAAANRRTRATAIARTRVEQLRATLCAGGSSGSQTLPGGLVETWSITTAGRRREARDSIAMALPHGRSDAVVVAGSVWCDP